MTSRTGRGPRATILLLDGARPDVLDHLRAAGDLPHLERHLLAGADCGAAVTAFPSTTGVAYLPFLTGCYPGTCDVPGIRWLDPRRYDGRWWR
ncbi:MAG: alkaline phosphatase family protein, partial [Gemmatimonadota bacterium]|nr:alkaline phosphatase family protein [Gemmatimonadota bacterium]